jgi:3-hydroxyisobutyrate dehydrogenase
VRLPDTYLRGDFTARFALQLAHKDVSLATALGREVNVPMRLASLCEQDLTHAMGRGLARHDASVVLTLQEERAQVQVRLSPPAPSSAEPAITD